MLHSQLGCLKQSSQQSQGATTIIQPIPQMRKLRVGPGFEFRQLTAEPTSAGQSSQIAVRAGVFLSLWRGGNKSMQRALLWLGAGSQFCSMFSVLLSTIEVFR